VALRQFFRFLKTERLCEANPTEDVDLPRFGRRLPSFLTVAEVDLLLAAPDRRTDRGARDGAMLETLYATGLRVSELVKLRLPDINLEAGYLTTVGKGGKQRLVPLGEAAVAALRAYVEGERPHFLRPGLGGNTDALFLTRLGRRMTRQAFLEDPGRACACRWDPQADLPAQAPSFLCHAPGRTGRRLARRAGHARPCRHRNHRDLHASLARSPAHGVRPLPPARVTPAELSVEDSNLIAWEPASFARRVPSREGMGTL